MNALYTLKKNGQDLNYHDQWSPETPEEVSEFAHLDKLSRENEQIIEDLYTFLHDELTPLKEKIRTNAVRIA